MNKRNRKIKQGKGDYVAPEAIIEAEEEEVELVAVAAKSKADAKTKELNDKYKGVSGKKLMARAKRLGIRASKNWKRTTIIKKIEAVAANDN